MSGHSRSSAPARSRELFVHGERDGRRDRSRALERALEEPGSHHRTSFVVIAGASHFFETGMDELRAAIAALRRRRDRRAENSCAVWSGRCSPARPARRKRSPHVPTARTPAGSSATA
jgi:hypothetical protein